MAVNDCIVMDFAHIDLDSLAELGVELPPDFQNQVERTAGNADNSYEELVALESSVRYFVGKLHRTYGVEPDAEVFLRNEEEIPADSCLGNLCVAREGPALIRFEFCLVIEDGRRRQRVNILDIFPGEVESLPIDEPYFIKPEPEPEPEPVVAPQPDDRDEVRWVVDMKFMADMRFDGVPQKVASWSGEHVQKWITWAADKFVLDFVNSSEWIMTGKDLMKISKKEFDRKVHADVDDSFWIHFQLLRTTDVLTVPTFDRPEDGDSVIVVNKEALEEAELSPKDSVATKPKEPKLWQFLLELLTDPVMTSFIGWADDVGAFKLLRPKEVAQLWGTRVGKENMNYERLGRALRYYYRGDMLAKVPKKTHMYKFVCDLQALTGFTAKDLRKRVERASRTSFVVRPPENVPTSIQTHL